MLLLTAAILAIATPSPDAQVEKKITKTTEIQEEIQVSSEETQNDEIAMNDAIVNESEASDEE